MDTSLSLQVLDLLRQTFICTLDTQRQAVEKQLQALGEDWLNFLRTLLAIITSRHQEVLSDVKISAASFVLMKARHAERLGKEMIAPSVALILAALNETEGHPASLLAEALEQLLLVPEDDNALKSEFFVRIEAFLRSNTEVGLKLLRALFSGGSMLALVPRITDLLAEVGESLLRAQQGAKVLAEWGRTAEQLVKFTVSENGDAASALASDQRLVPLLGQLLTSRSTDVLLLCRDADDQTREGMLFLVRTVSALFQFVLDNKQVELERLHQTKFTSISGFAAPEIAITRLVARLLSPLTQSLFSFCARPDAQARLSQETLAEEVVETLTLLTKACSDSLYSAFFLKISEAMIVSPCPVLLLRSVKETADFAENPEEYVSLALDVCDNRESMTSKTAIAQFLDVLCSTADGALAFATSFFVQMIDFTVTGSRLETLQNYTGLLHHQAAIFLRTLDEDRIDVSLLALCTISESILERKDLKTLVRRCISTHFATMARSPSNVIKTRLVLLCVKFACAFEREEVANIASMLEFLIFCLGPQVTCKALVIQASEGLSELMRSTHVVVLVEPLLPKLLEMCLAVAQVQTEKSFFEALEELLKSSASSFQQQLPQLLAVLVQKISTEYRQDPRGISSGTILSLKCWNIIQLIADCPEFVPARLAEVEQSLCPLLQLLGTAKLHFEDCICTTVGYLIQRSKTVTDLDWKLFQALPVVQSISGGTLGSIFFVLCQFTTHGGDGIRGSPERMGLLFAMGMDALVARKGDFASEEERVQGALLLQLLLTTYPGAFDSEFRRLFLVVFELYSQATKPYFKAKLAETILGALVSSPLNCIAVLSSVQVPTGSGLSCALQLLFEACQWFNYPYDRKITVLAFRSWALLEAIPDEMQAAFPPFFLKVFTVLNAVTDCKERKRKKRSSAGNSLVVKGTSIRIKLNTNAEKAEEKRVQRSVKHLKSALQELDEIQCFRETLDHIRVQSPNGFAQLIGRLGPELRQALVSLLQAKKVGETEVIRRVVRPKRPQANSS